MAEKVSIEIVAVDLATDIISDVTSAMKDGLAMAVTAVGAAFVASIGASIVVLKELTESAAEAEQSQARFNALVDSSPLAKYKNTMLEFANTLSLVTRFEDENILEAEAMLATYQTIGEDIFPQVLNSTLDLAEFMKTDATQAAETLGRAFSDIAGGSLTMLYRQKLLTQAQKDAAEEMAKTGDAAGAQAFVLDILDGKIGDLAETMGNTFQGRMTIFKNSLENIKEELGAKLLPVLQPVIDKLLELAIKYAPKLAEVFDQYVVPAVIRLADGFTKLLDALDQGKLLEFFQDIDWKSLSQNFADGINSIDWAGIGQAVGENVPLILDALVTAFDEIDWSVIFESLAVATKLAVDGIFGRDMGVWARKNIFIMGQSVYASLIGVTGMFVQAIGNWISAIDPELSRLVALFLQKGTAMGLQIIQAVQGMTSRVVNAIRAFIETLRAVVASAGLSIGISVSIPWGALGQLQNFVDQWNSIASGQGSVGGKSTAARPPVASKNKAKGFAKGTKGWETVPAGYPNDSYPIFLQSGEKYAVIPNGQSMPSGGGGGMGGGMTINLTYAPAFSTADKGEFISNITPMLNDWYRRRLAS